MKKMMQAVAVSAALMWAMGGAWASTNVALTAGPGGHYTGGFTSTHSASFTDTYTFTPVVSNSLVSASLISIGFTATDDITFSSVMLNGHALTLSSVGPV